jgi:casein kinase 1
MAVIGDKYEIVEQIGQGAFGCIYKGRNTNTGKLVAIKNDKAGGVVLRNEASMYRLLAGEMGFPRMRAFWVGEGGSFLVMDLLGRSLHDVHSALPGSRPASVVALLGVQLVERLRVMHEHGLVHRDVKPANLMFGTGADRSLLYLVDLGLARRYIDDTGKHREMKTGREITGTATYASVSGHTGCSQSRRDDLESAAYVLLELVNGSLPWGDEDAESSKRQDIWGMFPDVPGEFLTFLRYARKLGFRDKPNYDYLVGLLMNLRKHDV